MEVALGYFEDDDNNYGDVDLNRPPMSGVEYLKRVQLEAANCPDIVIATDKPPMKQDFILDEIATPSLDESKTFPCERVQLRAAEDFAFLRQKFNRLKAKCDGVENEVTKSIRFPSASTNQLWCRFCFGKDFTVKCVAASMKNTPDAMVPIINDGATEGQGNQPLLSILLKLKPKLVMRLLCFHSNWLNTLGFSYDQGSWLFSLLLCLDKPAPPDVTYTLRELCRKVINIRNGLQPSEENDSILHQLNLLIIIVTRYFGQSDLAMR